MDTVWTMQDTELVELWGQEEGTSKIKKKINELETNSKNKNIGEETKSKIRFYIYPSSVFLLNIRTWKSWTDNCMYLQALFFPHF
jgi:hypothetical protein